MIDLFDIEELADFSMTLDLGTTPTPLSTPLRQSSAEVLSELRRALQRAIGYGAGVGRKSRDVQKRFRVDFKLSWQTYRIVSEGNVLACAPDVPLAPAMKRLCTAFRQGAVPEADVQAVEAAYEALNAHIVRSAGDRSTFDAMMARLIGGETAKQAEIVHRRASFEAQRYIYGIEQNLSLSTYMIYPSAAAPDRADIVRLSKRCRLTRLNFDTPLAIEMTTFKSSVYDPDGSNRWPLDPAAAEQYGVPLLPAFCSNTHLPLRKRAGDLNVVIEWTEGAIGCPSAVDLAIGYVESNVPFVKVQEGLGMMFRTAFAVPMRRAILDLLVHRPTFGVAEAQTARWGRFSGLPTESMNLETGGYPRLPCYEQVEFMGSGATAAYLGDVPDHVPMLEYACAQMNWRLEEFDVYRLTLDFPLVETLLVRTFRFPSFSA